MENRPTSFKKTMILIISIIFICLLIVLCVVFFFIAPKKNREKADNLINQGKYVEADNILSRLAQTEEIVELRKNLFFESRVAHCAALLKDNLLDPESLRLLDVIMDDDFSFKNDTAISADINEIRYPVQPSILLYFSARTRGGGTTDAYCLFRGEADSYKQYPIIASFLLMISRQIYLKQKLLNMQSQKQ